MHRYFYDERAVALYTMSISGAGLLAWLELVFLLPPAHAQVAHVRIGLNQANRAHCRVTQLTVTVRAVPFRARAKGGLLPLYTAMDGAVRAQNVIPTASVQPDAMYTVLTTNALLSGLPFANLIKVRLYSRVPPA